MLWGNCKNSESLTLKLKSWRQFGWQFVGKHFVDMHLCAKYGTSSCNHLFSNSMRPDGYMYAHFADSSQFTFLGMWCFKLQASYQTENMTRIQRYSIVVELTVIRILQSTYRLVLHSTFSNMEMPVRRYS